MLLSSNFKFNKWGCNDNNLIDEYVWIKSEYLEILSFNDVKDLIIEMNDCSCDYYNEYFKDYENTINNLLKYSISY